MISERHDDITPLWRWGLSQMFQPRNQRSFCSLATALLLLSACSLSWAASVIDGLQSAAVSADTSEFAPTHGRIEEGSALRWIAQTSQARKPPEGIKFSDGWMLKWGDSMEILASHFAESVHVTLSAVRDSQYAEFDLGTHTWRWLTSPTVSMDECSRDRRGDNTGEAVCFLDDLVPFPFSSVVPAFSDDKFYKVVLKFSPASFETVEGTLAPALGKPVLRKASVLQNGYGAKFDQKFVVWKIGAVDVQLEKRSIQDGVNKGWLTMTYTPLAQKEPPLPSPQKPF